MAKLDAEPRLMGLPAVVIDWARSVVRNFSLMVDAIGNKGEPRAGTTSITDTLDGPAFMAHRSTDQTGLSTTVETVLLCDQEPYDTASAYNPANGRFTPQVAGFYQVNAGVQVNSGTSMNNFQLSIWKNGTMEKRFTVQLGSIPSDQATAGSALIYLNGTTDYVDARVLCGGSTSPFARGGVGKTYFSAHLARRA